MPNDGPDAADRLRADVERLAGELDAALARLEDGEIGTEWRLRSRLLRLEAEYLLANRPEEEGPRPPAWKRAVLGLGAILSYLLDLLQKLSPIATPILLALFGILLTGTTKEFLEIRKVELAEQQLDLATIQALDDHLVDLRAEDINEVTADQIASRIAYFGPRALVPLVAELRSVATTSDPRAKAISGALEVSALYPGQRERLCALLAEAMSEDMKAVFSEAGREVATSVHSSIGCKT
jgi:hypothetical protein